MKLPRKALYDLGRDHHGRRLDLIVEGESITLHREAVSQRDHSVWIELTREQIRAMAEVLDG